MRHNITLTIKTHFHHGSLNRDKNLHEHVIIHMFIHEHIDLLPVLVRIIYKGTSVVTITPF